MMNEHGKSDRPILPKKSSNKVGTLAAEGTEERGLANPGVGPMTALAFVLIIDSAERFACGKQIASYVGLIPCEDSSSDRRRLGHITKPRQLSVALPVCEIVFNDQNSFHNRTPDGGLKLPSSHSLDFRDLLEIDAVCKALVCKQNVVYL